MDVILDDRGEIKKTTVKTRSEAYSMLWGYAFFKPLQCVCIDKGKIFVRTKEEERGVLRERNF